MQSVDHTIIVTVNILLFVSLFQVVRIQAFKTNEDTSESCIRRFLDEVAPQNGVNGCGTLENMSYALHFTEKGSGKAAMAKEMVLNKIEMPTW